MEPMFLQTSAEHLNNATTNSVLNWNSRDSEVASAAMDAAGVGPEAQSAWMAAFADLLAEEPP